MTLNTKPVTPALDQPSPVASGLSRRRFAAVALSGATCSALAGTSAAGDEKSGSREEGGGDGGGWIDAHVHVWTPDTRRYPLAAGFATEDMQPRSFTPEQLLAHCRPAGVDRVVLIQMNFYGFDNRYMLDVIAEYPQTFVGVGIVDSQSEDVAARIESLAERGVRGLRLHPAPGEAAGWTTNRGMATVWKTAGEQGVAICPLINPIDLPHVDAMCAKFPDVRVVVDHFARVGIDGRIDPQQLSRLCRLARHPQVFVKTSAFYALGKKRPPYTDLIPMIRRLVDAFGPERLMWASDCPYQVQGQHTYAGSISLIRDRIDFLSEADKRSMLRGTAEQVFFSPRR